MTPYSIKTHKALLFHTVDKPEMDGLFDEDAIHSLNTKQLSLTIHDVKQSPTGSVIGAGRLISEADKQKLRDYLNGEDGVKTQWLPSNLLMINSQKMVWYVPSKIRTMHIKAGDEVLHIKLKFPSLVFHADCNGRLKVVAYVGNGRPKLTQPLYHAPLWNIYANTSLCSGTAVTTDIISVESMAIWEEAVFNTVFTHSNHNNVLSNNKAGKQRSYMAFIKKKAKSGAAFNVSDMTPLRMTLENWAA